MSLHTFPLPWDLYVLKHNSRHSTQKRPESKASFMRKSPQPHTSREEGLRVQVNSSSLHFSIWLCVKLQRWKQDHSHAWHIQSLSSCLWVSRMQEETSALLHFSNIHMNKIYLQLVVNHFFILLEHGKPDSLFSCSMKNDRQYCLFILHEMVLSFGLNFLNVADWNWVWHLWFQRIMQICCNDANTKGKNQHTRFILERIQRLSLLPLARPGVLSSG